MCDSNIISPKESKKLLLSILPKYKVRDKSSEQLHVRGPLDNPHS